jgi:hypothetical protein
MLYGDDLESRIEALLVGPLDEASVDEWLDYNTALSKLFRRLKRDVGATNVRQSYRGTGGQKHRRQMWVRGPGASSTDLWLESGSVTFGGIVSILPSGDHVDAPKKSIEYGDMTPEQTYKAIVANLKAWHAMDKPAPAAKPTTPTKPVTAGSASVRQAANVPELKPPTSGPSKSVGKLAVGDVISLTYKQSGGSPDKTVALRVTDMDPYNGGMTYGVKNVRSKQGRGGVMHIDAKGKVEFQTTLSGRPLNVVSMSKGAAAAAKAGKDVNPDRLPLTDFAQKWLSKGRPYVIRKSGDSFSLTGPRGAVYQGIRNINSGTVRFIDKPVERIRITDRNGKVQIVA